MLNKMKGELIPMNFKGGDNKREGEKRRYKPREGEEIMEERGE